MAHKSRSPAENKARANHVLKAAGYAKGGAVKTVNVIIKTGSDRPPVPPPMPMPPPPPPMAGPPPGGPPMPPRPPMGGPPGMMPPGAGPMATGGTVRNRASGGSVPKAPAVIDATGKGDDYENFSTRVNGPLQTGRVNNRTGQVTYDDKPADWYTKDPFHGSKLATPSGASAKANGGMVKVKSHVRRARGGKCE